MAGTQSFGAWAPTWRAVTPDRPGRGPAPGTPELPPKLDLTRECLRLSDRYVQEVVLAFGLCPWAEPALRAGQVRRRVCLRAAPSDGALDEAIGEIVVEPLVEVIGEVLSFIDELEAMETPTVEIGLLLFPRFAAGWAAFDAFGERVRRADRARRAPTIMPTFLVATFHPQGVDSLTHRNQLLSFIRRSPDPMLQLVRASTVYDLKDRHPDISDEVAHRNWTTLAKTVDGRSANAEALAQAVHAIHHDRATCYGALALPAGATLAPGAGKTER
jgi:hypothetical protein